MELILGFHETNELHNSYDVLVKGVLKNVSKIRKNKKILFSKSLFKNTHTKKLIISIFLCKGHIISEYHKNHFCSKI